MEAQPPAHTREHNWGNDAEGCQLCRAVLPSWQDGRQSQYLLGNVLRRPGKPQEMMTRFDHRFSATPGVSRNNSLNCPAQEVVEGQENVPILRETFTVDMGSPK